MLVSWDRYELPLAVADSKEELAELIGVTPEYIKSVLGRRQDRNSLGKIIMVVIDEEDDERDLDASASVKRTV